MRLKEPAATRVRYGDRRLHVLLGREGWLVNARRVYRLSAARKACRSGLSIRPVGQAEQRLKEAVNLGFGNTYPAEPHEIRQERRQSHRLERLGQSDL
jgi:hypothetical protein